MSDTRKPRWVRGEAIVRAECHECGYIWNLNVQEWLKMHAQDHCPECGWTDAKQAEFDARMGK
jgi:predicted RNA-binding Zn-ribbon protein involved in translation (DUF1610 family)